MIPTAEIKKLRAFHGDASLKKDMVAEIEKHRKADQIEKGTYGKQNGKWKGCAVACSVRSLAIIKQEELVEQYQAHTRYQTDLGIPESLAHLEDYLFETMPNDKAQKWPSEFIRAIKPNADLSLVAPKFIVGTLKDVVKLEKVKGDKAVVKAVLDVAKLWEQVVNGKTPKASAWSAAESAAWSAAESAARSAAESAAWSAAESAARSAAESAAESAARSAAESAARSAAESAASYKMSRRLLKLLRACK